GKREGCSRGSRQISQLNVSRKEVYGKWRLQIRIVQSQLRLMQSGVGLVHSGERGIKFGLGLIKVRSGQTLSGVKGLRALEVLPCLDMLCDCLTYLGFCL